MADTATGVIPPLPMLAQAEAAAAGIFEVITEHHCATLVLIGAVLIKNLEKTSPDLKFEVWKL
jgi:hypothetical protein